MKRRFLEWLDALDPALRAAIRESLVPWLGTAAMALLVILVAGVLPATRDFFQLDVRPALLVWSGVFGFALCVLAAHQRHELSSFAFGTALLSTCGVVLFFAACMISLSRPPGSSAMAALFILAAAYYGHVYRISLRFPFGGLAIGVAFLGALALNRDPGNWMVFSLAGPAAFGGSWLLGTNALRADRARQQSASFKAAVQAQILDETSRDVSRLSGAMLQVLQTTHDASNALSTALINAELLRKASGARVRGERPGVDEEETAEDLTQQLLRLRNLVEQARKLGHAGGDRSESLQAVAPLPVVSDVLRELRVRFPGVGFGSSGTVSSVLVVVSGGVESLRRMLENLVLNACQGNGREGAQRVDVSVHEASTVGSVAIRVCDDGPGFAEEQLQGPITGFQSTKSEGTGLGLYTAERLARASGGSLTRTNREQRGAEVTIFLRSVSPE